MRYIAVLAMALLALGFLQYRKLKKTHTDDIEPLLNAYDEECEKHKQLTAEQKYVGEKIRLLYSIFLEMDKMFDDRKTLMTHIFPARDELVESVLKLIIKFNMPIGLYNVVKQKSFDHVCTIANRAKAYGDLAEYAKKVMECK